MKVLVIGSRGNMGRRYMAILKYLEHETEGYDTTGPNALTFKECVRWAEKIIVATPTDTHLSSLDAINFYNEYRKVDVLCEKPVARSSWELDKIEKLTNVNCFMVNNYAHIFDAYEGGTTLYDFYHSGSDGLIWDCIQLVHLAKNDIILRTVSPMWSCAINGNIVPKVTIDASYVAMVKDFLGPQENVWNLGEIETATQKCLHYESTQKSFNRYPSEIYLPAYAGKGAHGSGQKTHLAACGGAVQKGGELLKQ